MQRRDLLKGFALGSSLSIIPFASAFAAADQVLEADLCVVGAGAGGISAGLSGVENGLKTVVLEKLSMVGGGGNFMEGTFAVGSHIQRAENIGINAEKQFKKVMDFHHWRIPGRVLNGWLKETAETIAWSEKNGVNFQGAHTMFIDGTRTWHMFEGGHGSSLIKAFTERYKKAGGTLLTSTPAKSLTVDDKGAVTGVVAETTDGRKLLVKAKAVVVATGGFANNKEMVAKYLSYPGYMSAGAAGSTGDGTRMMEAVGAKLVNMGVCMQGGIWLKGVPTSEDFGKHGAPLMRLQAALQQPLLKVSLQGDRVVDESEAVEYVSNAFEEVGGQGFIVFDDDTRRELVEYGMPVATGGMVPAGEKFTDFEEQFAVGVKRGFCFKADTLEGLAKKTGMDPARLKFTCERMNAMTKAQKDDEFYKDARWLRAVKTGPFYAIQGELAMFATTGGASVDTNYQVLNAKGYPIPGLYAIGQDAGGLYSDSYDMHIAEGTASSWAITGGRMAARHVAELKKQGLI